MTDLEALHAAVLAEPDDDTPRLIYADELEERGWPGDADRAEFVRVQCACERLAPFPPPSRPLRCPTCDVCEGSFHHAGCRYAALRERERHLFRSSWLAEAMAVFPGSKVECWYPVVGFCEVRYRVDEYYDHDWVIEFRRGFVDRVTVPADVWVSSGGVLVASHSISRVELCDKRTPHSLWFDLADTNANPQEENIPPSLFGVMREMYPSLVDDWRPRHIDFRTNAAALDALSVACLEYGRRHAVKVRSKRTPDAGLSSG